MRKLKYSILIISMACMAGKCSDPPQVQSPANTQSIPTDHGQSSGTGVTTVPEDKSAATEKQNAEDAAIALQVKIIMSHSRQTFRQEIHDYGPKAVPYLLSRFQNQTPTTDGDLIAMCLGAIGDERAVEPIISKIEEVRWNGGSVTGLVQALGYLAAQGSDRAYKYLVNMIQPENWERNEPNGTLIAAVWALVKSNREDALSSVRQVLDPVQIKSASKQTLTSIERDLLTFTGPDGISKIVEEIKLTGIFGYYNSEIRAQKGIVDTLQGD